MRLRRSLSLLLACAVVCGGLPALAAKSAKPRGEAIPLIRDAEIEGLMRTYTKPLFKAAGLNVGAAEVVLINNPKINAFVAGGQRIFVHTGLLMQAKTPNEVIGVLAHETGHIAGGHLARLRDEMSRASTVNIVGMLLGAAAVAGGAATGNSEAAQAGQGLALGSQSLGQRLLLNYARTMESSADQAALTYLNATGQSGRGMLNLFQKLSNQTIGSIQQIDPYVQSHPMPLERIRTLQKDVKTAAAYGRTDKPELVLRHQLMQAKLMGFLQPTQTVFQRYPKSNTSLPARYARAIAMFRTGDTRNALPVIDSLIADLPENPYFWELKGQALFEGGQAAKAIAPLKKSAALLPGNGLIQMQLAQALLGTETRENAKLALAALSRARKTENDVPRLYQYMAVAHGVLGDVPRADLATAEQAYLRGDRELATEKAEAAQAHFKRGSSEWLRANDLLNFLRRK